MHIAKGRKNLTNRRTFMALGLASLGAALEGVAAESPGLPKPPAPIAAAKRPTQRALRGEDVGAEIEDPPQEGGEGPA